MISNIAILKRKKILTINNFNWKVMGRVKFIKGHFLAILTIASCLNRQLMQWLLKRVKAARTWVKICINWERSKSIIKSSDNKPIRNLSILIAGLLLRKLTVYLHTTNIFAALVKSANNPSNLTERYPPSWHDQILHFSWFCGCCVDDFIRNSRQASNV